MSDRRNELGRAGRPIPAVVGTRKDEAEFRELKEAALDLLQLSLADLSPDKQHILHLKMGIEREGHFLPPQYVSNLGITPDMRSRLRERLKLSDAELGKTLDYNTSDFMRDVANMGALHPNDAELEVMNLRRQMDTSIKPQFNGRVEQIYRDSFGTFMLEQTTAPLSPKEAATTTREAGQAMLEIARREGFTATFSTLPMPFMKGREAQMSYIFGKNGADFHTQVFHDKNQMPLLVGRGQHANLSVWCGTQNLFNNTPFPDGLAKAVVNESQNMLPGMILPTRGGNYWRIQAKLPVSIQTIDCKRIKNQNTALRWEAKMGDCEVPEEQVRIEYRQGASDVDPLDIALAAAIPATKASMEHMVQDHEGKARMNGDIPQYAPEETIPKGLVSPMPSSEEEAAELFNPPDGRNPNFTFLNELASHRLAMLRARIDPVLGSAADKEALRQAEKLENIGTKLHQHYCRQYGLESHMAIPSPYRGATL